MNVIYKNGKLKQELDFNKIKLNNIEEVFDIIKNNNAIYNKDELKNELKYKLEGYAKNICCCVNDVKQKYIKIY